MKNPTNRDIAPSERLRDAANTTRKTLESTGKGSLGGAALGHLIAGRTGAAGGAVVGALGGAAHGLISGQESKLRDRTTQERMVMRKKSAAFADELLKISEGVALPRLHDSLRDPKASKTEKALHAGAAALPAVGLGHTVGTLVRHRKEGIKAIDHVNPLVQPAATLAGLGLAYGAHKMHKKRTEKEKSASISLPAFAQELLAIQKEAASEWPNPKGPPPEYEQMNRARWSQLARDLPVVAIGTGIGYAAGRHIGGKVVQHLGGNPQAAEKAAPYIGTALAAIAGMGNYALGQQRGLMKLRRDEADARANG